MMPSALRRSIKNSGYKPTNYGHLDAAVADDDICSTKHPTPKIQRNIACFNAAIRDGFVIQKDDHFYDYRRTLAKNGGWRLFPSTQDVVEVGSVAL